MRSDPEARSGALQTTVAPSTRGTSPCDGGLSSVEVGQGLWLPQAWRSAALPVPVQRTVTAIIICSL